LELAEAAAWYEAQQLGLGSRLLDQVEQLLPALVSRPEAFPRLLDTAPELEIRRALLPRFPFGLVFMWVDRELRVLAVAHARRRPGYWLDRVTPGMTPAAIARF
jgi:hypothetical protein